MHTSDPTIPSHPPIAEPKSFVRNGIDLRLLAKRQRLVLWLVLACAGVIVFDSPGPAINTGLSILPAELMMFVLAAIRLSVIAGTILVMRALRTGVVIILIAAFLMLVPLLNLIFLLLENRRASRVLRNAGLHVGLMGVKDEDVLRALAPNLCRQCGYDLTANLSGICPECGNAFRDPSSPLPGRERAG